MVQCSWVLANFTEDLDSVPCIHIAVYNPFMTPVPEDLAPSGFYLSCMHMWQGNACGQNNHTNKIKRNRSFKFTKHAAWYGVWEFVYLVLEQDGRTQVTDVNRSAQSLESIERDGKPSPWTLSDCFHFLLLFKTIRSRLRRDGTEVKGTGWSSREPESNYQYSHGGSQLLLQSLRIWCPLYTPVGTMHTCGAHGCR